jgi:DNA-binding Xre family transcriptional regulator
LDLTKLQALSAMTDRELARVANVSTGTLYRAKIGDVKRRKTMEKIARALGVAVEDVTQFRENLREETLLTFVPTPELQTQRAWELLTDSLVRRGYAPDLRKHLERAEDEYGEEGLRHRERIEAEGWQELQEQLDQEREGGPM